MPLHTYLPQDRLRALMRGTTLPDRTSGSALFVDISGFTPLTEKLTRDLGARRGIDELTLRINSVYDALIGEVDHFGGVLSVLPAMLLPVGSIQAWVNPPSVQSCAPRRCK